MKVKFKDGHEIEFKQFGKIWLAESVIWEETELHCSLEKLRELKTKASLWFAKNAPKKICEKFNVRLPLSKEIKPLSFKDQIAYREGRTDKIADYFIGDEDHTRPVYCNVDLSSDDFGWFECDASGNRSGAFAVRLCLEERK